ncbi:MAG TPA: DUF4139 domain-containing protein [Rhizomicrobium sp.]|jgi:hypothetical protein
MNRTILGLLLLAGVAPVAAWAADQTSQPQQLSVTIYNNDLALVQDQRKLDVTSGRNRIEFKNVSAKIKPETVALSGKGLSVVEQNFDFDLLTPSKMMEKAVGKQVQIVRTNPGNGAQTTETATVLSVNEGVVLKIGNRIEVLRDDGVPTRVIFSSIPENLRASPTLSVTVDAAGAGRRDATLSYLTTGLSWKADYVALFDEKQSSLKFQGWVTLTNSSGTTYANAKTQLIAGDINLVNGEDDYWRRQQNANRGGNGRGNSSEAAIADYKLYQLPDRVTIAQNETKQVGFLDLQGVKAAKGYSFRVQDLESASDPEHADVVLTFNNTGHALPSGIVRVYMRDEAGEPKFVGEDDIGHTQAGSDVNVKIGEAFDVTVQPTLVSSEYVGKTGRRCSMSYVVHNAKPEAVTVDLRQVRVWTGARVETESLPSKRISSNTLDWSVPVPANGETTVTVALTTDR